MSLKKPQLPMESLWKAWKEEQDSSAEEQLARAYLPLVERVVQYFMKNLPQNVDREDLFSWGQLGLLDALRKFDYERGLQFETYAVQRIRGAMIDGLRKDDWAPRSVRDKAKKLEEAFRKLEQIHMRPPTREELAGYLQMPVSELERTLSDLSYANVLSLDEPGIQEEDKQTLLHRIVDDRTPNQEQIVEEEERKKLLAKLIEELPPKEKLVVALIYYEELTLTEVAEVMDLTPGRISQLHSKALSRLRQQVGAVGLA